MRLSTREVALGRAQPGELKGTRTVSHDRRHVAYVAKVAGGEAAYVDGVAGKTYPAVASDPLSEAGLGSPFTFSRDGRRVAYVVNLSNARARGPRRVVVDGQEGPALRLRLVGRPALQRRREALPPTRPSAAGSVSPSWTASRAARTNA